MANIGNIVNINKYASLLLTFILFNSGMYFISLSASAQTKETEIKYYEDDNVTNQLSLFDNRFKIDAQIEELTLLFYRTHGSEPIILVRPDGSKLSINNFYDEGVDWFDSTTFDMIKMKKPMPGPWQAIGHILPNSKIMVVSEVKFSVAPLPKIILKGETLKLTGQLYNADKAIDNPRFREVISLGVNFYSTNNSEYDNFGADAIQLNSFRDDGRDLDEYAADNVFTGEFELDFSPGEWVPTYTIALPMAERELRQTPIIIQASPITHSVVLAEEEGKNHQVYFNIDDRYVDVDSLAFQGNIIFPDKQVKPFSIMNKVGEKRVIDVEYTEPGLYRVNARAFGKTLNGREFRLAVDEFTFNVEFVGNFTTNEVVDTQLAVEKRAELLAKQLEEDRLEQIEQAKAKQQQTIITIVVANLLIILIALLSYFFIRWRKKKQR